MSDFVLARGGALALASEQMTRRAVLVFASTACCVFSVGCAKKKHVSARVSSRTHIAPNAPIAAVETGLASWYGNPYHGRAAANGEIYDMDKLTAAHRTLPFGTMVRVTRIDSGQNVEVRITDRGPFVDGRIIDLSRAAARAIDLIGPGVAEVRVDPVYVTARASELFAVQVGAFREKDRAEKQRSTLDGEYGGARLVLRDGSPPLWRVLVGRERSPDSAAALADRLRSEVGPAFVVRLDE
jgi:rare lipoprotein A